MVKNKEYIFTFPNIGLMRVTAKYLLESLGIKTIPPPPITQKTIDIGFALSDEQFCMPFKVNIGDLVQAIEMRANAVLIAESEGQCRFGGLWVPAKKILEKHFGREIEFFPVNQVNAFASFNKIVKVVGLKISREESFDIIERTIFKTDLCEEAIALANSTRPKEQNRGQTSKVFWKAIDEIDNAKTWAELKSTKNKIKEMFTEIAVNKDYQPIKVMLTGSIFDIVVPSSKFQLVEMLGNMGVEVISTLGFHDVALLKNIMHDKDSAERAKQHEKEVDEISEAAKKYVGVIARYSGFGGFALFTVGNAALAKDRGYDAVIHIYPFGCMPEIVARTFLSRIRKEKNIPIISLMIDEHTGGVGFITRIEAFVDMVKERKFKGGL